MSLLTMTVLVCNEEFYRVTAQTVLECKATFSRIEVSLKTLYVLAGIRTGILPIFIFDVEIV